MQFKLRANAQLSTLLGDARLEFLRYGLNALERLLPHTAVKWQTPRRRDEAPATASATFSNAEKKSIRLRLSLPVGGSSWDINGELERRRVPTGVGSISRTMNERERQLARAALQLVVDSLSALSDHGASSTMRALQVSFDERVVVNYLESSAGLSNIDALLSAMRQLAEQSYENKSLTFGCIIKQISSSEKPEFPGYFLSRKRYRALSDGYSTAYILSANGRLLGFKRLNKTSTDVRRFYPEWSEELALETINGSIGVSLTRQGDILVFMDGSLAFTYRFGRWQHWNHSHLVDLLRNLARVQNVPPSQVAVIVRKIYRAALDVSFRRSGALFVLLRTRQKLHELVRHGEAIHDDDRDALDSAFDEALDAPKIQNLPRKILTELSSLDGAIVLSNSGTILAYGAVLEPKRRGRITGTEGSRTKAAIGASNYGLAVKVSSDGDISVFVGGKKFVEV